MSEPPNPGSISLRRRLLLWFSIALVVLLAVVGFLVQGGVRELLVDRLAADLEDQARIVALSISPGDPAIQANIEIKGRALDERITVVSIDGHIIADSEADPATMDDHSGRPEIVAALAGEVGVSRRFSDTTGETRMYVALPPVDGLIVRVSVTEASIEDELGVLSGRLLPILVLVGIAGLVVISVVSARIVRPISALTETASSVAGGRLEASAPRSSIEELDELGLAIGAMASELGRRIRETEEERQTMESVLGALPQGLVMVERDDRISYANSAARRLLAEVPERLGGLAPTPLQRLVRDGRARKGAATIEFEPAGPYRLFGAVATPFPGDDGRVLIAVEDVTDRHRIEAIRRDFVADASHELKTPVASILASMETLQIALERDPERAKGFARQVEVSARRLARIVDDLLDLSRLEVSEEVRADIDLLYIVREETERLRPRAAEAGVTLETDLAHAPMTGSESDLALAVRNLCDNAIRYTDPGGSVSVTLRSSGESVELSVSDTGAGIPTRALSRVFERFYRVDVARSRDTGGTGLGLAIVKHVAERHGGSVSVESELGAGSTFRMRLPTLDSA